MRRPALTLAALALVAAQAARAGDVVSPAAEKVGVTIYRDGPVDTAAVRSGGSNAGLALISETRTLDLPAGRSRVKFEGVADGIIPESAAIEGLPGGTVERNFDYDILNPATLLQHSIGQTVTLRRIDAKTGKVVEEPAVVRSGPDGAVLATDHGVEVLHCSGGAEGVVFERMPEGLSDKPTLSALVDAPAAGRYVLTLSYLSVRLNWSADYVADIAPGGRSLDLLGWVTLSNRSSMSFANAPTAVVAGRLNRVAVNLPRPNAPPLSLACWPNQTTHSGWIDETPPPPPPPSPMMEQSVPVAVSAFTGAMRMEKVAVAVTQSQLGDYKLYSLNAPTTVASQQTKQIAFLHQGQVKFEVIYAFMADAVLGGRERPMPAAITLRFENKAANGLGQPLPQGTVWLRQQHGDDDLFIGSKTIEDVAVDAPFEVISGLSSDVRLVGRTVSDTRTGTGAHTRRRLSLEFVATNAKAVPVNAEVRYGAEGLRSFAIAAESASHTTKAGDPLWRLTLPPNGAATLNVTIEYDE